MQDFPRFGTSPTTQWTTLTLYGSIVAAVIFSLYQWLLPKPLPAIPYNKEATAQLFGDIPQMSARAKETGEIFTWTSEQNRKHNSPIIQIFGRPFSKPWVILTDFRESQDILTHRSREFDRSQFFTDMFAGPTPQFHAGFKTNAAWKNHRNLVNNLMTPPFLDGVAAPNIYIHTLKLIDLWNLKLDLAKGRPFMADRDIYDCALDIILASAFDIAPENNMTNSHYRNLLEHDQVQTPQAIDEPIGFPYATYADQYSAINEIVQSFTDSVVSSHPYWRYKYLKLTRSELEEANRDKDRYISDQIDRALKRMRSGEHRQRCAVDEVLQKETEFAEKQGRAPDYKQRPVLDELFGFLLGGHDSTASTLRWAAKHFAVQQGKQDKLRATLQAAFPAALAENRNPTIEEIVGSSIPYLEASVYESVRMGAPAQIVIRQAVVDTTVLGFPIPKGTDLFLTVNGPDFQSPGFTIPEEKRSSSGGKSALTGRWDESTMGEFDPGRWIKTDKATGEETFDPNAGQFLGWGGGPRGCYGRRLAVLEVRLVLTLIIWNFRLAELPEEMNEFSRTDGLASEPRKTFVRLEKASRV